MIKQKTTLEQKLISVVNFIATHPGFKNRTANYAICWKDASSTDGYLINLEDVDSEGQCDTFYYKYSGSKQHPEHPLIGLELASRADKITEVEPGLYRLKFS